MQLLLLIAVAGLLWMADAMPEASAENALGGTALVLAAALVAPGLAWLGTQRLVRRLQTEAGFPANAWRRFERLRRGVSVVWAFLPLAASVVAGWPQIVRWNWGLAHAVLLDEAILLAPLVGSLLLTWNAFYTGEYAHQRAAALARGEGAPPERRGSYLVLLARHYFGLCLLPVLAVVAANDLATLGGGAMANVPDALVFGPILLALLAGFPWLLSLVWRTSPLPQGELRQTLERIARAAGLSFREIRIWHTGNLMMNAAVAGFLPRWRYVFLTDGLLARLTPQEVAAAFAHEVGHVRRRHLSMRLLILAAPALLWLALSLRTPGMVLAVGQWFAGHSGVLPATQASILAPLLLLAYAVVVLGWFSRLLEHEADLWAAGLVPGAGAEASLISFVSALERLTLLSGIDRNRGGWLHPSIARRVDFLVEAAQSPQVAHRFQLRVGRVFALWMAATAMVATCVSLLP